jgi:hypothetical protein
MNEASICRDIVTDLKKAFPRAIVYKLHDLSTAGIPDIVVTFAQQTFWIEVKFFTANETLKSVSKHFDRLQLANMRLLETQGKAFYLIAMQRRAKGTAMALWSPATVALILDTYPHPEETLRPESDYIRTMDYVIAKIGLTS